jgi:hypothetical protein
MEPLATFGTMLTFSALSSYLLGRQSFKSQDLERLQQEGVFLSRGQ